MPFWAHFRQSYRGSISATAQCIETQLMPNESVRRNLQHMQGHFYVKLLLNLRSVNVRQSVLTYFPT